MAAELIRPGVEIIQVARTPAPTFLRPTLVPCVVGPAYEVVNVLTNDGTLNADAKWGAYRQLGSTITQSAFPDPRGNNDELDILESTIRPFLLVAGSLGELPMAPGSSFLCASHGSSKAALKTKSFGSGLSLVDKILCIAIDQPVAANTTSDVTITFEADVGGGSTLTAAQAAAQINEAVGSTVATVVNTDKVQIASLVYGAMSSVTVRKGYSANSVLEIGYGTPSAQGSSAGNYEQRVEGSGYRAQDDNNNNTTSPWIEFYRGAYYLNNTEESSWPSSAGLIGLLDGTFTSSKASAVTFGDSGTVPVKVGDYVFADGQRVKAGEISKVESTRFKVGTINVVASTADENGRYTKKVYDTQEVGTLYDTAAFAPAYVWFRANGLTGTETPVAAKLTGTVAGGTAAAAASIDSGAITVPAGGLVLAGLTLDLTVTTDGVEEDVTFTITGGPYATIDALVTAISTSIDNITITKSGTDKLNLATNKTGRLQAIKIKKSGTANSALSFSTSSDTTDAGNDVEFSGLTGKTLKFRLDSASADSHEYEAVFTSNSLDEAVEAVNAVVGATVASIGGTGSDKMVLTSPLKGLASAVWVTGGTANATLGLAVATSPTYGTGRPLPDAYLDGVNNLVIGSQLVRDSVTGYPLNFDFFSASIYVQFKALRRDVSARAKSAGVLRIPDQPTLSNVLSPLTDDNPLGLATFLMMVNAPGLEVKCLGIDEVSAAAPEGTEAAWARAAGFLEAEEVYAIAPLTQSDAVHGTFATHAFVMSEPAQGGERIVFINKKMPTHKNPVIAASGTSANSTSTADQVLLESSPVAGLVDADINPALPIPVSAGVYLEMSVASELRRYNIKSVSGALVSFNRAFSAGQNDDGFYSTAALTEAVVNSAWVIKVRGESLVIPGSNPPVLDYSLVADTVAGMNSSLKNRRVFSVFPDKVKVPVAGTEKTLPGYYACAAIAGMVASQPPQQGFTNFPVAGVTGTVGPENFSRKQLNVMAGGGTYILFQETPQAAVSCRHQVSTDLTSVEYRELSITKSVDFTAKFLRSSIRQYIGVENVTDTFLDTLAATLSGLLQFLVGSGTLRSADVNNIIQDEANPDTVLVDVTLLVNYPANYIRITLVV